MSVHIVLSDTGWILERLAKEIADRLPYVSYGLAPDPSAVIQYYITYGSRRARVSQIEIALFTHREADTHASALFDMVAREVDHAVSMSSGTAKLVEALGVTRHSCIMPGVDLDIFRPKLKIAVVGRTYHTGRKGEALVNAVMDVPDIEWHFTGSGWPGPALNIAEEDLPEFYRSMSYILVPALNEGGPMSVLEALASGVQVIAPDVGWVPDFPHIPFERGDAASLRRVLTDLVAERMKLRASVEQITWDNWAAQHDDLFRKLIGTLDGAADGQRSGMRRVGRVALVSHGIEDLTLGGPSVRVPKTASTLRAMNVNASVFYNRGQGMAMADLVHGFNIWQPKTAVGVAREAKRLAKPLIFSPIMLDLSEAPLWQADVLRAFRHADTPAEANELMQWYGAIQRERVRLHPPVEPDPGYHDMICEIAGLSDGLIFLSDLERRIFRQATAGIDTPGYLVRNPVDAAYFSGGNPDLFRDTYGLREYVLCVARIEPRKNQLMLVSALCGTGLPVVLIGHDGHHEYADLVKRFGGSNLLLIDRINPNSEMLRSALAGARTFALPSWAEGAPLAALEAAAAGANMVLSDRSGEREYFGEQARYCDPADMSSIRQAVLEAWETPPRAADAQMLGERVAREYSWERHAQATLDVYEEILAHHWTIPPASASQKAEPTPSLALDIIFDITAWANNPSASSGIGRVESMIALELLVRPDLRPRFVMYLSSYAGFIELPREVVAHGLLSVYVEQLGTKNPSMRPALSLPRGGNMLTACSSLVRNTEYFLELKQFAHDHALVIATLMHDISPALFSHWYPVDHRISWQANFIEMIATADRLLIYSESMRNDLTSFALAHDITLPVMDKIRLADKLRTLDTTGTSHDEQTRRSFAQRPFILSIGGVHPRKNYTLLYDVWQILRDEIGDACPHLVIIGGVSWGGDELARMMLADSKVKGYIHILDNVDDGTLTWLYEHALATAYPSLYEAWGLPVGESLAHGKICLASNISPMNEIAPEITDLIDPYDRRRWAARIRHYAASAQARAQREHTIRETFVGTDWGETTQQIVRALSCPTVRQPAVAYNIGVIAIVTQDGDGGRYLGSGWYQREKWGCWARRINSSLTLRLVHTPNEDIVLSVLAKVLKPADAGRRYDVRVNGAIVATWHFSPVDTAEGNDQEVLLQRAIIPAALAASANTMTIEFIGDRLTKVCEAFPKTGDQRSIGLGLVMFFIEATSRLSDPAVLISTQQPARDALGADSATDLPAQLTGNANRPSLLMDNWTRNLAPFLRAGVSLGAEGAASQNGSMMLALGLARVRFDRDLTISLIIDAPAGENDRTLTIEIFVNDQRLHSITLDNHAPARFEIVVPQALMVMSDPLDLALFASGRLGTASIFVVDALRLGQGMVLPSERRVILATDRPLLIGMAPHRQPPPPHMLEDVWYDVEAECVWSIAQQGRLRFAVTPAARTALAIELEIDRIASGRDDDRIDIIMPTGVAIAVAFPPDQSGARKVVVPIALEDDGSAKIELGLVPNNATWPNRIDPAADPRRLGVQLFSVNPIEFGSGETDRELIPTGSDDIPDRLVE